MASDSFEIQYNNINITSGTKSKEGAYTVTDTVGQTAPGEYSKNGYLVRSGFQYIYTIGTFSFSITNTSIDLGLLSSEAFSDGTTQLKVSTRGGGYVVSAYENHPLTLLSGTATIPDTQCDSGLCTELLASEWTQPQNDGFGYNIQGDDVPAEFTGITMFKQFANWSSSEIPQVLMSNTDVVEDRTATMTIRASAAGSQTAGSYDNNIIFIATPLY